MFLETTAASIQKRYVVSSLRRYVDFCRQGIFGLRDLQDAHMIFFSRLRGKFSKSTIDMETMFSLKSAHDPRLHLRQKKNEKKN